MQVGIGISFLSKQELKYSSTVQVRIGIIFLSKGRKGIRIIFHNAGRNWNKLPECRNRIIFHITGRNRNYLPHCGVKIVIIFHSVVGIRIIFHNAGWKWSILPGQALIGNLHHCKSEENLQCFALKLRIISHLWSKTKINFL